MAYFRDQQAVVLESLRDAGCDQHLCQEILHCLKDTQIDRVLYLLRQHKKVLLSQLHEVERKIDVLDYFVYSLNKW